MLFRSGDDEEGDRTYPSRTEPGAAWSLGEKHPDLVASKSFFWGLINVPMWNYYYGMTLAQIELLTSDCPIIIYNTKKDKKDGAKKPRAGEVNDAMRRWKNKYGKKGNKVNLDLNEYK